MKIDEVIEVRCDKIAHGGYVVARHEGVVIFVRQALPGELVKVRIVKSAPGKRAWIGETLTVLEKNEHRVTPPCEYFKAEGCGGCDFQHADIDYQLLLKKDILIEQLNRLANISALPEIITHQLDPKDFNYRSKIRLTTNEMGELGFRKFRSNQTIPITHCKVALPAINSFLAELKDEFINTEVELISTDTETIILEKGFDKKISTRIGNVDFIHFASGFWQSHIAAAEKLSEIILKAAIPNNSALDLFAGVGIFGRLLLENNKISKLTSVELDKNAAACATENLAKFANAKSVRMDVEKFIFSTNQKYDLVLLDPPRSGLGQKASARLAEIAQQQIIYIACDPASLARDTKVLVDTGWQLCALELVDAFPQTHHMETVAIFAPEV